MVDEFADEAAHEVPRERSRVVSAQEGATIVHAAFKGEDAKFFSERLNQLEENMKTMLESHADRIASLVRDGIPSPRCSPCLSKESTARDGLKAPDMTSSRRMLSPKTERSRTPNWHNEVPSRTSGGLSYASAQSAARPLSAGTDSHHQFMIREMDKLHHQAAEVTKSVLLRAERKAANIHVARAQALVTSRWFEMIVSVNIVVNALAIALKADYRIRSHLGELLDHSTHDVPLAVEIVDFTCTSIFVIEIGLRVVANGCDFFSQNRNPHFWWNMFDLVLVIFAVVEISLSIVGTEVIDASALRLLGLGRLVRMIPAARSIRSLSALRVMLLSITYGISSIVWGGLMIAFVLLLAAIIFMEGISGTSSSGVKADVLVDLRDRYGGLWKSLYTMYLCMTGGLDWVEAAEPLFDISSFHGLMFCVFIGFSQLCLLNVLTGIFVDNASTMSQRDEDTMMLSEFDTRQHWIKQVVKLFTELDRSRQGNLNREEFLEAMQNVRIRLLLQKLGIDIEAHRPESLFALFDYDGDGCVQIEEFVMGLHHFHGHARSVDVAKLRFSVKRIYRHLHELQCFVMAGMEPTASELQRLQDGDMSEHSSEHLSHVLRSTVLAAQNSYPHGHGAQDLPLATSSASGPLSGTGVASGTGVGSGAGGGSGGGGSKVADLEDVQLLDDNPLT